MGRIFEAAFMKRLTNDAYVALYEQIVTLIDTIDHNIESDMFDLALSKTKEQMAVLTKIRAKDRVHFLTDDIQETHNRRYEAFRSISLNMRSNLLHLDQDNRTEANYFEKWYRKHDKSVKRGAQDVLTRRIDDIEDSMTSDSRIIEAVSKLGMSSILNNLFDLNKEFKKMLVQRSIERSLKKALYVNNNTVRANAYAELESLLQLLHMINRWKVHGDATHLEVAVDDLLTRVKGITEQARTRRANLRNPIEALNFKEYDWAGKDSVDYSVLNEDDLVEYREAV